MSSSEIKASILRKNAQKRPAICSDKKSFGKRSDIPFADYLWDEEKTKKFNCLLHFNNIRQMLQKKLKSCFKSVKLLFQFQHFSFFFVFSRNGISFCICMIANILNYALYFLQIFKRFGFAARVSQQGCRMV